VALSRIRVGLDFVSDWAVVAFGIWTLIAYVGMATGAPVPALLSIWAVALVAFTGLAVRLRRRPDQTPKEGISIHERASKALMGWPDLALVVSIGAGVITAFLVATMSLGWWFLYWTIALGATVAAVVIRSRSSPRVAEPSEPIGRGADWFVIAAGLAFATLSLFVSVSSADDVFYVNRATATAQLGHIPVLDVIFTHEEVARAGGAGLPVDSYSALQGALARPLGIHAASVAYLIVPPVMAFLAAWALWRLLRLWAPRRAALCFFLACIFWLWSAQYELTPGNFFLTRIWQGKAAFVAWLVPTIFVYLTKWLAHQDSRTAALLLFAGLGSIGMTGSATFVAPLIFLTALIPLLVCRQWRALPVPFVAGAIPLAVGLFAVLRFPLADTVGAQPLHSNGWLYHEVLGAGVVGGIAGSAICAAVALTRAGSPRRLAGGIAIVTVVVFTPTVLPLLHDLSGLTTTLRRTLWFIPLPALVGLLAAIPVYRRMERFAPVALTVALAGLLIAFGHPLWTGEFGASRWASPGWKIGPPERLSTAKAILARYEGDGPILVRREIMKVIALLTVEPKAVNARTLYLERTREARGRTNQRLALTAFVMETRPRPKEAVVRHALSDLGVGLVCLGETQARLIAEVESVGPYRRGFRTHGYLCLERETVTAS
jgi:Family of unknown function (DUF6077)